MDISHEIFLILLLIYANIFYQRFSTNVIIEDRIYIFEDIDCAGDIVHKRKEISGKEDSEQLFKPRITLSEALNVLDGFLELKNTIIIMTTNYVNKLYPALIRKGW